MSDKTLLHRLSQSLRGERTPPELRPTVDLYGVPWCHPSCPQLKDGFCIALGGAPSAICEPSVRELAMQAHTVKPPKPAPVKREKRPDPPVHCARCRKEIAETPREQLTIDGVKKNPDTFEWRGVVRYWNKPLPF